MSTLAQVGQLAEPLVRRNDDLALVGREILLLPMHHFSRSVHIDRTSTKGEIQPFWQVTLLFAPSAGAGGWSDRLFCRHVDDPETRDIFEREVGRCFNDTLRPVRDIESLMDMPSRAPFGRSDLSPLQESLIVAARGFFDEAFTGLAEHIANEEERLRLERDAIDLYNRPNGRPWHKAMERHSSELGRLTQLRMLLDLLRRPRKEVLGDFLRSWERSSAHVRGHENLWQPAPFPFEGKQHRGGAAPSTATPAVKRWMEPLLQRRPDLFLAGRRLLLRPVRHLCRGIHFGASPTGIRLRPRWFIDLAFAPPSEARHLVSREVAELESTFENFDAWIDWFSESIVDRRLMTVEDIQAFNHNIEEGAYEGMGAAAYQLAYFDEWRGVALAALGRLEEARTHVLSVIRRLESDSDVPSATRVWLAKHSDSALARNRQEFEKSTTAQVLQHKRLLALLETADRAAIAALLHEWERQNVRTWGIEHFWEPTPFPLETGSGS
jgi:hypothetical protein